MATRKRATRTAAAPAQVAAAETNVGGRSEEDILLQRPIEVTLAGKTYEIALLPIRAQAAWRRKVIPIYTDFLSLSDVSSDDPEAFRAGMMRVLAGGPDELLNLFFEYAVGLVQHREDIENTATEWEVAAALRKIVDVVIPAPLLDSLRGTLARALR